MVCTTEPTASDLLHTRPAPRWHSYPQPISTIHQLLFTSYACQVQHFSNDILYSTMHNVYLGTTTTTTVLRPFVRDYPVSRYQKKHLPTHHPVLETDFKRQNSAISNYYYYYESGRRFSNTNYTCHKEYSHPDSTFCDFPFLWTDRQEYNRQRALFEVRRTS